MEHRTHAHTHARTHARTHDATGKAPANHLTPHLIADGAVPAGVALIAARPLPARIATARAGAIPTLVAEPVAGTGVARAPRALGLARRAEVARGTVAAVGPLAPEALGLGAVALAGLRCGLAHAVPAAERPVRHGAGLVAVGAHPPGGAAPAVRPGPVAPHGARVARARGAGEAGAVPHTGQASGQDPGAGGPAHAAQPALGAVALTIAEASVVAGAVP